MGVPGADDVMLNYQSTSFHDAAYLRRVLGKRCAPEFERGFIDSGIADTDGKLLPPTQGSRCCNWRLRCSAMAKRFHDQHEGGK